MSNLKYIIMTQFLISIGVVVILFAEVAGIWWGTTKFFEKFDIGNSFTYAFVNGLLMYLAVAGTLGMMHHYFG